jgi:hypothetical protein
MHDTSVRHRVVQVQRRDSFVRKEDSTSSWTRPCSGSRLLTYTWLAVRSLNRNRSRPASRHTATHRQPNSCAVSPTRRRIGERCLQSSVSVGACRRMALVWTPVWSGAPEYGDGDGARRCARPEELTEQTSVGDPDGAQVITNLFWNLQNGLNGE